MTPDSRVVDPVLPDYRGPCVLNVVPSLLEHSDAGRGWMPAEAIEAPRVVVLVIDGLGWHQLQERRSSAPTLAAMAGGPVTTVAPSTTATALTSIVTGATPGEHGLVGYRIPAQGEVLNVLQWSTVSGDARTRVLPREMQSLPPFFDRRPPVVTRSEFAGSGFTEAHLRDVQFVGYRFTSALAVEVSRLIDQGAPFVYAYYDGIDRVAHELGFGRYYEAELRAVDRLVGDLLESLPTDVALVVLSDHGQVDVGERLVELAPEVMEHLRHTSGEARFRWLHARPGRVRHLAEAARAAHADVAWVVTRDEVEAAGWFGPVLSDTARDRLGDVAVVAHDDVAFVEPGDRGRVRMIGRHGSLTAAEMLVPLLAATGTAAPA